MADQLNPDSGTKLDTNKGARKACIRKAFNELYMQNRLIDRKREEVMKPLTDGRTKLWRDVKADVDIPRKILEAEYKLYELARMAKEFADDEDDGDLVLDNMREVFEALHPGGQLDLVKAINGDYATVAEAA